MARTRRRKDHNKAVAHRRVMKALADDALPPHPVEVGKKKFMIVGNGPEKPVTAEEIAALPEVHVSGSAGHVLPGEVVHVHDSDGRPFYARVAKPLRGRTRLITSIDDFAEFPPHLVKELKEGPGVYPHLAEAFVDGQEVPAQVTPTGYVQLDEAPVEGSQVQIVGIDWAPGVEPLSGQHKAEGHAAFAHVDYAAIENAMVTEALKGSEKGLEYIEIAKGQGLSITEFLRAHDEAMFREFCYLSGPRRVGMTVQVTPRQEAAIRDQKFRGTSMGCTVTPDICSICGAQATDGCEHLPAQATSWPAITDALADKLTPPGFRPGVKSDPTATLSLLQSHLEMGVSLDADGKPRFEEISICPGPDPNGITDLRAHVDEAMVDPDITLNHGYPLTWGEIGKAPE